MEARKTNSLRVARETEAGYFLTDGSGTEVLMPASFARKKYEINEQIQAFVYTESGGKLIASPRKPSVEPGGFALLRATAVTGDGAFMDWGLEKDLFIPFSEQAEPILEDKFYVVRVYTDEVSKRIVGSTKIEKFLSNEGHKLEGGQEVNVLLYSESELGFSCIINGKHKGLIYHNEIFQDLFVGEDLIAYIKTIREDGLIDVSLQKSGFKNVLSATDVILSYLETNGGKLDLHDKSSPREIAEKFSMSKATFKKAIGILYRQRKVLITPLGVNLVQTEGHTGEELPE